jgi:hypothetical protein
MAEMLTDKLVKALEPPVAGNRILYDADVKGFGLRITKAGARAFILNYRAGGRNAESPSGAIPTGT